MRLDIHVYIHNSSDKDVLADILARVKSLQAGDRKMEKTLDDILADVEAQKTVNQSAITLLGSISQQLKDAKGDPAKIQAIADSLETNNQALADALVANTPAA